MTARRRPFRITLACGCTIKTRNSPFGPHVTYHCGSGLRHGYTLSWVTWTDTDTGRASTHPDWQPTERQLACHSLETAAA